MHAHNLYEPQFPSCKWTQRSRQAHADVSPAVLVTTVQVLAASHHGARGPQGVQNVLSALLLLPPSTLLPKLGDPLGGSVIPHSQGAMLEFGPWNPELGPGSSQIHPKPLCVKWADCIIRPQKLPSRIFIVHSHTAEFPEGTPEVRSGLWAPLPRALARKCPSVQAGSGKGHLSASC